jgi:hypothetical protein
MLRSSRHRARLLARLSAVARGVVLLLGLSVAGAITLPVVGNPFNGVNDLAAISQGIGQTPQGASAEDAEPPLVATPRAVCGPHRVASRGSRAGCRRVQASRGCGAT